MSVRHDVSAGSKINYPHRHANALSMASKVITYSSWPSGCISKLTHKRNDISWAFHPSEKVKYRITCSHSAVMRSWLLKLRLASHANDAWVVNRQRCDIATALHRLSYPTHPQHTAPSPVTQHIMRPRESENGNPMAWVCCALAVHLLCT
ncbi:hypothetical protein M3J09_008690 [Ascochyta lentis]